MPREFKRYRRNRRVINDLKKRSTIGILFYLLMVCVIFFPDGYYLRHPDYSRWFLLLIFGVCLFRYLHLPLSRRMPKKYEKANHSIFLLSVLATALIWGSMCAIFMIQKGEYDAQMNMVICTTGLCAGGVVAFIPDLPLSIGFNLSMLMPSFITILHFKGNRTIAIMFLAYSIYLMLVARRGNKEYWDALETEYLLERKTADLERISRIDVLTQLYNRRYFDEVMAFEWKRSVRRKSSITMLICDIDHFKQVNDRYGHLAGDEYLKLTADLLKGVFKRDTDIVARYGGEEFVVLMTQTPLIVAIQLAEKVRMELEKSILHHNDNNIQTTLSVGIADMTPEHGDKKKQLVAKADQSLYLAKNNGRNQVRVSEFS